MAQAHLGPNQTFEFVKATANQGAIADPEIGQPPDGYVVPAAQGGVPGASVIFPVKNNPNKSPCAFTGSGWTAPNMPHMGLNPVPVPMPAEEEGEEA